MEMFQYSFIQYACVASVFASIVCGVIGTYVVVKRLVFLSGGLAHTAFGGLGLAHLLKFSPLWGAGLFSLLAAIGVGQITASKKYSEDTAVGILWPLGMAVGVLFISMSKTYGADLFSYLFGNLLLVSSFEIKLMAVIVCVMITVVTLWFHEFQAICFDEEFARIRGVRVKALYILLLCLIALAIVVLVRVVGIVLAIALLSIPAAISKQYMISMRANMVLASILSFIFINTGIYISYLWDLPAGASIIIVACVCFSLSLLERKYCAKA